MAVRRVQQSFLSKLKSFISTEIHVKSVQDENPVLYILREVGKDYLIVDYGESQRMLSFQNIIFVQIGSYPKAVGSS